MFRVFRVLKEFNFKDSRVVPKDLNFKDSMVIPKDLKESKDPKDLRDLKSQPRQSISLSSDSSTDSSAVFIVISGFSGAS